MTASSTSDTIFSSPTSMEWHVLTGIKKDISALPLISSMSTTFSQRYTSQMTPFRKITQNIADTSPTIRSRTHSFKITSILLLIGSTISRKKFWRRWSRWERTQLGVSMTRSTLKTRCTTSRSLGWISWLIGTSSLGWLRSTPTHVWIALAHY